MLIAKAQLVVSFIAPLRNACLPRQPESLLAYPARWPHWRRCRLDKALPRPPAVAGSLTQPRPVGVVLADPAAVVATGARLHHRSSRRPLKNG